MINSNISMLNNTLKIFKNGSYLNGFKSVKVKLSMEDICTSDVLLPENVKDICSNLVVDKELITGSTEYTCINDDSYSAAIKMKGSNPNEDVLVLNFANAINPGGGVRGGARAQEEDLCRRSSLLISLEDESAKEYYRYNAGLHTNLGSDAIIITPKVEVIKNTKGELLDESVIVSVMTCAAPIMPMEYIGREVPEYEKLLYTRIIGMLKVAAYYGYKNLVLGAWGCGAFGNDALVLARLFNDAFNENIDSELTVGGLFNKVEFAVLDRTPDQYNYSSFNKYFSCC